jgi:tRNA-dihydrouridine synthase 2
MTQARYLKNNWGLTKFCASQFSGRNPKLGKSRRKAMKQAISQAKCYEDLDEVIDGCERGKEVFESICEAIRGREEVEEGELRTPNERIGLIPEDVVGTPRWPSNEHRMPLPADGSSPTPEQPMRVRDTIR